MLAVKTLETVEHFERTSSCWIHTFERNKELTGVHIEIAGALQALPSSSAAMMALSNLYNRFCARINKRPCFHNSPCLTLIMIENPRPKHTEIAARFLRRVGLVSARNTALPIDIDTFPEIAKAGQCTCIVLPLRGVKSLARETLKEIYQVSTGTLHLVG